MSHLGVACIQLAGAKSGNLDLLVREVESIAKAYPWIDMVVTGELAICGPSLDNAEPAGSPTEIRLQELARRTGLWLIPGSLHELRGENIYNTALIINPEGEIIARYDKMFPFLPYEKNVEQAQTMSCLMCREQGGLAWRFAMISGSRKPCVRSRPWARK